MPFPCEAFKGELYRLVHSPEEHATALAEGWSAVRDPAVTYKPLSSTWVLPKREAPASQHNKIPTFVQEIAGADRAAEPALTPDVPPDPQLPPPDATDHPKGRKGKG